MRFVFLAAGVWLLALAASAGDGVIEINQAKALAGGVTPCDTPGFPVSICDSGSYRLTSNLTYTSGASGAVFMTGDVTLDLNGMTILGDNTCTVGSGGWVISCVESFGFPAVDGGFRTVVANGRVLGASGAGVLLSEASEVRDLLVSNSGGVGVKLGSRSVATRISVIGNFFDGVVCGGACELSRVTATNNGFDGINTRGLPREITGSITGSVAIRNGGSGFNLGLSTQLSHFSSGGNRDSGVIGNGGSIVSFGALRDNPACGLKLTGSDGYHGVVVSDFICGGVNLGSNSCQPGPCPP